MKLHLHLLSDSTGETLENIAKAALAQFDDVEVLRHSGLSDLGVGEAVALRVVDGRRGLMAAQIAAWERGAGDGDTVAGGGGQTGSHDRSAGLGDGFGVTTLSGPDRPQGPAGHGWE